ncbi:hypothetical protein VNI00_001228 [Paramarasmius palmivorus]|uniref:Yeast cell wall synthesis Kre9/Knh1-like N-terminal domain-containing protein n=1 Tax=Paramarasmius palmivorus TaxID=297713 RepID=A0AAW0EAM2_9AGAR
MLYALCIHILLAASTLAYKVTYPAKGDLWSGFAGQTLQWDKVSTDQDTFAIFLTSTNREDLPRNNVLLKAIVDGNTGRATIDPPNGGWPSGKIFRVNLCKNENSPESILAQSPEFEIVSGNSVSSTPPRSSVSTISVQTHHSGAGTFTVTDTFSSIATDSVTQPNDGPLNTATSSSPQMAVILAMLVGTLGALLA